MANPDSIIVNVAELEQTASNFHSNVEALNGALNQVTHEIHVLQESWQSHASDNFGLLMDQWKSDIAKINQVLEQVGKNLRTAADYYRRTDQDIFQGFQARN